MDLQELILKKINKQGQVTSAELTEITGFSRAYLNRFFRQLVKDRKIALIGKANSARYVLSGKNPVKPASISKILKNDGLQEDLVLEQVKNETSVLSGVTKNLQGILAYAFTEIMNNAIEHSRSKKLQITFQRNDGTAKFIIRDFGIGVFKKVMSEFRLRNETEAINHLLKGKQTTSPKQHSGEGLFFTSKVADEFILESFGKKLVIDNIKNDIFVRNIKPLKGTRATFTISLNSKRSLKNVFAEFAGKSFEFSKTRVLVRLGLLDNVFLSRSQARRVIFGLDKFKEIVLDFKGVDSIGQSFADEIFRVWQKNNPKITIIHQSANDNTLLMIKRALNQG